MRLRTKSQLHKPEELNNHSSRIEDDKEVEDFYIPRIKEMYRILKPTGSIYLQMDNRIVHYVRIIMEDIFGNEMFTETWQRLYYCRDDTAGWSYLEDMIYFKTASDAVRFKLMT